MTLIHTQKSLDALTWNEIQKLHFSLGLKTTATTRTRRDYQRRIIAAQPQPVVEPEHIATPLTCATCPLARHIDGDRYCCGLTDAVTRGHWEAKSDCYEEVAKAQPEIEVVETEAPIATVEATSKETVAVQSVTVAPTKTRLTNHPSVPETTTATTDDAPPNRGDNGRGRVEAIAPIAPAPKSHSFSAPVLGRVERKQRPIWAYIPPEQVLETIVWQTPFKGEILGKSGYRPFFVENDVIYVVLESRTSTFCASETRHPNYHHKVIRQAIEAGKQFEPSVFKQRANARGCPSPKYQTYWWKNASGQSCNLGQLYQNCDGWWWAWAGQGDREGRKFHCQSEAQKYLKTAGEKPKRQGLSNHPFRYRWDIF